MLAYFFAALILGFLALHCVALLRGKRPARLYTGLKGTEDRRQINYGSGLSHLRYSVSFSTLVHNGNGIRSIIDIFQISMHRKEKNLELN